jgi:hypothetical protein
MHFSVISRWFFIFLALLVFASCNRAGGKIEAGKAKSTKKTAVTSTVRGGSTPKRTTSNTTTSKKTDVDYNGVTQFHAP